MLKEMDYVFAVYEERSFSKAAEKLYISQPALSAAVKRVEQTLGAVLFDRSTSPIGVTAAGERYAAYVKRINVIRQEMMDEFGHSQEKNRISLGGASYFCTHILPELAEQFHQQNPDCHIDLIEDNSPGLINDLDKKQLDFILNVEDLDPERFDSICCGQEQILLAVPAEYPINQALAGKSLTFRDVQEKRHLSPDCPAIDLALFREEPFLLLRQGNDIHQRGLEMCRRAGFSPQVVMYLDQMLTSYHISARGSGIAFIRDGITHFGEDQGLLHFYKIADSLATRTIKLAWKIGAPLSPAAEEFLCFVREREAGSRQ